ncbi:hypothetical protein D910_08776 [Dendroctonus ponderosae]|uniref:Uncharacterized protein n=1 Tax=Dendroctonus ponderosae TaxID=77166 RepID=U4UMR5_DENPD|nr:hypothetical protein D910_08776 [Dendroctonus ponderosae]
MINIQQYPNNKNKLVTLGCYIMAKATSVMKQIRIPLIFIRMRKYFREYCKCSSIHGFRYFGEDRTYFERYFLPWWPSELQSSLHFVCRIWWFVVFNIVVAGCVYSITLVYEKWNDSPVIVSFDTRETKLDSIPFPAVTICPETKSVTSKFNYIDVMLKLKGRKVDANITEIEPKTIFASCIWRKLPRKCEDLFTPIITDEGICYTFNMLDRNDLFKENVVPLDETVLGALQPVKITTSQNVARYKLHQRQCYIDKTDTNPLKYFNIYSQLNCNLDCLTTFTLKTCGCVNFYMPRTNGTKICGSKRAPCMYNAEHYITHVKKKDAVDEKTKTPKGSRCNCMPICSDLSYHIETTQAKWDWPETFKLLYPNNKKFTKYAQSK